MTDKQHIRILLEKYIDGQYTPEELDELLRLASQPEDLQQIETLIDQYFADSTVATELSESVRLKKVLNRTDQVIREAVPVDDKVRRFPWRWITTVAAALLITLSISIFVWQRNNIRTLTISATGAQPQQVYLPDGSQVWINAGATLTYPEKFTADKRTITLSDGQAFFDVARDEKRPFTVNAGTLSVQVLGTSFEVTTYKNREQASVAVQTGTVNVSTGQTPSTPGTTLTANQKATINIKTGAVETSDIDSDDIAGWKENRLVFSGDDFATVIEALQRKYNVSIDLKKPALLKEKITLRLDDQPVQTAIEILSISSNFNYEFANDSTIVIR